LTDARVIEKSWADPEQFAAIFDRYFGQIHRYLARRVGSKLADDLAADVFVAAFAQRTRYDLDQECARPWLYGIATNLVGTQRRREQRYYHALARSAARQAVPPADAGDQVADRVSAAAAGPALAAALATLPPVTTLPCGAPRPRADRLTPTRWPRCPRATGTCCCWSRWPS